MARKNAWFLLPAVALLGTLACGNGQWGGDVRLLMIAPGVTPGTALATASPDWELVIDDACLSVEAVALFPEAAADAGGGEDCFCHGDPPECHGDCSGGSASSEVLDTVAVHRVVDLLDAESATPARLGLWTGSYHGLRLVLAPPHGDDHGVPLPCGGGEAALLHLVGTLRHTRGATAIPLRIDLEDLEIATATLDASPALALEDGSPRDLVVGLDLGHLLAHLDVEALVEGGPAEVVVGGPGGGHPEAVEALAHALAEAALWTVTAP